MLPMQVAALLELQRRSGSGVIDFDAQTFEKFAVGKSRAYTIVVVAGAVK